MVQPGWGREGDRNLDLFAARRPIAFGRLIGLLVDSVHHCVFDREVRIRKGCGKAERS